QFIVRHTNRRRDRWGGPYENRIRFVLDIIRSVRQAVGDDFIQIYRMSLLDLVPDGSTQAEIETLAGQVKLAGADLMSAGIGWHGARVPTIAAMVPRAAFTWLTVRLKKVVRLPLITSNRINTPEAAEAVLAQGHADLISMARPLLADP